MKYLQIISTLIFSAVLAINVVGSSADAFTSPPIYKGSMIVAHDYFGVPEENFFGYEYMPAEDYTESWWSAFLKGGTRATASLVAHSPSAIVGIFSKEVSTKMLAQVEAENRKSSNLVVNRAQKYLDLLNQLEPVPRGRDADVAERVGYILAAISPIMLFLLIVNVCFRIHRHYRKA